MKKLAIAALMFACVSAQADVYLGKDYSGSTYYGKQMQKRENVVQAEVLHVRPIKIQDEVNYAGQTVGAGLGAIAFLQAASNMSAYTQVAGAIASAVVGGAISKQVADKLYETSGYEITVRAQNGQIAAISQADIGDINVGDTVFVASANDGTLRIYR